MSHSLVVRGREGRVKVGYHVAAELGAFTLTPEAGEWRIDAAVISADEFWVTQDGTRTLELTIGTQRWSWRNADRLAVDVGAVTGTVTGSPERR